MITIPIKLVRKEAIPPTRQTEGSAGMDLHACLDQSLELTPGNWATIPTGIAVELPIGIEAQIRARSGFANKHGVGLVNGIGTIDSDYRGEICIILMNWGEAPFVVRPGMRIAQMVLARYEIPEWNVVDELSETARGGAHFGSTGDGGQAG
jgi:dUTP pyrophosphatase